MAGTLSSVKKSLRELPSTSIKTLAFSTRFGAIGWAFRRLMFTGIKAIEKLTIRGPFSGRIKVEVSGRTFPRLTYLCVVYADIKGLGVSLKELNLIRCGGNVLDFSPMSQKLVCLQVSYSVALIHPKLQGNHLGALVNLTYLELVGDGITSVEELRHLSCLEWLDLSTNDIVDVSPLGGLTKLKVLYLSRNDIVDLSPLGGLTKLEDLYVSYNSIVDLSPLRGLTRLEDLRLDRTDIESIEAMSSLCNLRELDLSHTRVRDLSPLRECKGLRKLNVTEMKARVDLYPLLGLTDLQIRST